MAASEVISDNWSALMRDLAEGSRSGPIRCSIENDCLGDFPTGDLDESSMAVLSLASRSWLGTTVFNFDFSGGLFAS